MGRSKIEDQALELLNAFERAGKVVGRVSVEGKRIELFLSEPEDCDQFERIEMRHGKA